MNKSNFSTIMKSVQTTLARRSPEILTGIGIAGLLSTTVLAVRATPKALRLIEESKKTEQKESLTPTETIKVTWKCYVPAATTAVASVACLVGASSVNARRNAALAAAYNLSTTAFSEYKEKVIETIGEKKEQNVREKIVQDKVDKNPVNAKEVIITGKGTTLCYDAHTGRYFESDRDSIISAVNELNGRMLREDYVSLNDFYDELGLRHSGEGDELGWRIDDGFVKVDFSSHLADDGRPCLAMMYNVAPKYNYYKMI